MPNAPRLAQARAWAQRCPDAPARALAARFGIPERSARAILANLTRRRPDSAPRRNDGGKRVAAHWPPAPAAALEFVGTGWLRVHPDTDPDLLPAPLHAWLTPPRRVRVAIQLAPDPGRSARRGRTAPR
jgi:hypothetical protein